MSSSSSTSQETLGPMFYVSGIDVSLATDSHKTIESIKLSKNDSKPLRDVATIVYAGNSHREEFNPLLSLELDDRISVLVNYSSRWQKQVEVSIDIDPRDDKHRREEQGVTLYRRKERKVEVVVTGYHQDQLVSCLSSGQLLATTAQIIQACPRFRLLIIGNSGVGKSSLIHKVFGVEDVHASETTRGAADIEQEFISPTNERFVVHDSLGFEAGDEDNMAIVKQFVAQRRAMSHLKDRLHAMWLCIEIPYAGGRLLEAGVEKFLQRRKEILGDIPLVVVLTKVDLLDAQLEIDLPADETLGSFKSKYLDEHCINPLHTAAGKEVIHVTVSTLDGYSNTLPDLLKRTDESMAKYCVGDDPRFLASIAQRISIKEKIGLSIAIGRKKYWNTLLKSAIFRGHTLEEYLQVIRKDIITAWNFNDPDECLMDDKIIGALLRTDNLGDVADVPSTLTTFASILNSSLEILQALSGSGDPTLAVLAPVAGVTIFVIKMAYETYCEAKKDVKLLMAYIIDLICVMQAIFLLTSSGRVTPETVALAVKLYEKPRVVVHRLVDGFDGELGRGHVLDKIEEWIWRYSIADHEIEGLSRKVEQALAPSIISDYLS